MPQKKRQLDVTPTLVFSSQWLRHNPGFTCATPYRGNKKANEPLFCADAGSLIHFVAHSVLTRPWNPERLDGELTPRWLAVAQGLYARGDLYARWFGRHSPDHLRAWQALRQALDSVSGTLRRPTRWRGTHLWLAEDMSAPYRVFLHKHGQLIRCNGGTEKRFYLCLRKVLAADKHPAAELARAIHDGLLWLAALQFSQLPIDPATTWSAMPHDYLSAVRRVRAAAAACAIHMQTFVRTPEVAARLRTQQFEEELVAVVFFPGSHMQLYNDGETLDTAQTGAAEQSAWTPRMAVRAYRTRRG